MTEMPLTSKRKEVRFESAPTDAQSMREQTNVVHGHNMTQIKASYADIVRKQMKKQ